MYKYQYLYIYNILLIQSVSERREWFTLSSVRFFGQFSFLFLNQFGISLMKDESIATIKQLPIFAWSKDTVFTAKLVTLSEISNDLTRKSNKNGRKKTIAIASSPHKRKRKRESRAVVNSFIRRSIHRFIHSLRFLSGFVVFDNESLPTRASRSEREMSVTRPFRKKL